MVKEKEYDELNISQKPALELLENMGYTQISPSEAQVMRGNLHNVILKNILYERLKAINDYEYKGVTYQFSEKNVLQAMEDIDEALTDGLIKTNEKIYDSLLLGRSYPEIVSDVDGVRSFNINYIDWDHPENNVFHVVEEFSVEKDDAQGTILCPCRSFVFYSLFPIGNLGKKIRRTAKTKRYSSYSL